MDVLVGFLVVLLVFVFVVAYMMPRLGRPDVGRRVVRVIEAWIDQVCQIFDRPERMIDVRG
jgi:hypothetical protein